MKPAPLLAPALLALVGNVAAGLVCASAERRALGVLLDRGASPWTVALSVASCGAAVWYVLSREVAPRGGLRCHAACAVLGLLCFFLRVRAWQAVRPTPTDAVRLVAAQAAGQELSFAGHLLDQRGREAPGEFRMVVESDLLKGKRVLVRYRRPPPGERPWSADGRGARVKVLGRVEGPSLARNPGELSTSEYLLREGVSAAVYASALAWVDRQNGAPTSSDFIPGHGWLGFMVENRIRRGVEASVGRCSPSDVAAVLAVVSSQAYAAGLEDPVSRSGLAVPFRSRSARCVIWSLLFMGFARLVGARRGALVVASGIGACLAGMSVGLGPSAVRGMVVATAGAAAVALGRPRSTINWLAGALLVVLVTDPLSPVSPSFWIGFTAAAAAGLGGHRRRRSADLTRARPRAGGLLYLPARVAAAVLPLAAYYFGKVDPASTLAGALLYPFAACLHAAAALLAVLGPASGLVPGLGQGLALACRLLTRAALWEQGSGLGCFRVAHPSPLVLAAYEVALLVWLGNRAAATSGCDYPDAPPTRACPAGLGRRVGEWVPALTGLVLALSVWLPPRASTGGLLSITFLSAGEADAAVIRTPDGACVLVDAGKDERAGDYLVAMGLKRVNVAVVTHWHSDHAGGLAHVFGVAHVDCLISGSCLESESRLLKETFELAARARCESGVPGEAWARLAYGLRGRPLRLIEDPVYLEAVTPSGVRIAVIGCRPGGGEASDNSRSLVVAVRYGAFAAVLPGDVPRAREAGLVADLRRLGFAAGPISTASSAQAAAGNSEERARAPLISVLKAAHHGSGGSNGFTLLAAVKPKVCIVPVGPNPWGHPTRAAMERVMACGSAVLRTDMCGAVSVVTDGVVVKVSGYPVWARPLVLRATAPEGSGGSPAENTTVPWWADGAAFPQGR